MTAPPDPGGYYPAPYRRYPEPQPQPAVAEVRDVSDLSRALEPADPYAPTPTITGFQPQADAQVVLVNPAYAPFPPSAATPRPNVGLIDATKLMLVNGTNFTGRASRSEFWMGTLALVIGFFLWVTGLVVLSEHWYWMFGWLESVDFLALAGVAVGAALILPHAALTVRRLHDSGHSGALWFLNLLPGIGSLIVAGMCTEASNPAAGHYDDPRRLPKG